MPASWALVVLLVGVHVATSLWQGDRVGWVEALLFDRDLQLRVEAGGQYRSFIAAGQLWRLCTSVLLHGDALHLGVNAVALVALGRLLEPWVGAVRFLAWFCIGGTVGSLVSHAAGLVQSDGASGGAFALLGAVAVLGWRIRDRLDPEDRRLVGPVLWAFIVGNVVLSFVLPFVDAVGHLGGLGVGGLLGFLPGWRRGRVWSALELGGLAGFAGVCCFGFWRAFAAG